ncbi:MAG: hypothetical protein LVQ97_04835 [Candidatus Micrarchaeales archaeon]|jgi:5'(3')-deoxyribonucleotidase|uniref:Nucleotidase n=1 Tax=Candidatus Micrarchaeum acidiphilum ARMAN-2 TaxID=425595 RepID=C7DGW5_MICA2|nr:MAG: hypothetical protein UNLARM2_0315 [Candidatus Micrarchaeum acidiphilum ARMAN-2]MCW6161484.1 hypothetical protein [Candidatus Micrarchaeales archaeon]
MAEIRINLEDRKKRIAIDLDDTIADVTSNVIGLIRTEYGIDIKKEDITDYNINLFAKIGKDRVLDAFIRAWDDKSKIALVDKDIPRVMAELRKEYVIDIFTATSGKLEAVLAWLYTNNIRFDNFVHLRSSREKLGFSDYDAFIDDNPMVAEHYSSAGKKVFMLRQPWNESLAFAASGPDAKIVPVSCWAEILAKLGK